MPLRKQIKMKRKVLVITIGYLTLGLLALARPVRATNNGNFSLSLWAKPTGSLASKVLIGKAEELRVFTDAQGFVGCQIKSTSWQTAAQATSKALVIGSWSRVVCTYDLHYLTVYVNGAPVAQTSLTAVPDDTANVLKIGQDDSASTSYGNLAGTVDDFKFYNYALTAYEVKADYNDGAGLKLGSAGTVSSAPTVASNAAAASYCVPGDSTSCTAPVAEWNFSEGNGQYAQDTSGNSNTGTLGTGATSDNSDPAWVQNGKQGGALKFDGSDDLIGVPDSNNTLDIGQNFSISAWIKRAGGLGSIQDLVTKSFAAGSYSFYLDANNKLSFVLQTVGIVSPSPASSITDNDWHHVAVTRSSVGNTYTFYLDGRLYGFAVNTHYPTANNLDTTVSGVNEFNGSVDQVRIYNYARTPAQIAWDYNQGAPVAHYRFDECNGSTVHSSNTSYDSNLNGTIVIGTGVGSTQSQAGTCEDGLSTSAWNNGKSGKYSSSLNLDGVDDYVTIPDFTDCGDSRKQISAFAWVKGAAQSLKFVVTHYDYGTNQRSWRMGSNSNFLIVYLSDDGSASDSHMKQYQSSVTAFDNSWHFIGYTFNNGTLKLYVDGKEDPNITKSKDAAITTIYNSSAALTVGSELNSGSASEFFAGQIDDVRVYNYALTATQVKTLYNENSAVRW